MIENTYKVQLDNFEGPLDLLLHLIEKHKIDIYNIPIATLTDQYLKYINQFKKFNPDIASEFLVMASTLLNIKSKMLLPKYEEESVDEEKEEIDPRRELMEKLLEYKRFKEVSKKLEEMQKVIGNRYFREKTAEKIIHLPPDNLDISLLVNAFYNLISLEKEEKIIEISVKKEKYSLNDIMENIILRLEKEKAFLEFKEIILENTTRAEKILSFLAILELIKQKKIEIIQDKIFSPIFIKIKEIK